MFSHAFGVSWQASYKSVHFLRSNQQCLLLSEIGRGVIAAVKMICTDFAVEISCVSKQKFELITKKLSQADETLTAKMCQNQWVIFLNT